jgi:hypothetical protein
MPGTTKISFDSVFALRSQQHESPLDEAAMEQDDAILIAYSVADQESKVITLPTSTFILYQPFSRSFGRFAGIFYNFPVANNTPIAKVITVQSLHDAIHFGVGGSQD